MKEINNTIPMKTSPIQKGRLCSNNPQEASKRGILMQLTVVIPRTIIPLRELLVWGLFRRKDPVLVAVLNNSIKSDNQTNTLCELSNLFIIGF